jgi:16S rRNA (guanine966-N2)-methyltransferase
VFCANSSAHNWAGQRKEALRVVGGKFGGRILAAPPGRALRPTSERVREAVFNILEHGAPTFGIEGSRVLDLFAGTGALGLEALSRGARFCLFVDDGADARGLIRRNADALGLIGQCKIWRRDAVRLGRCAPQPPYDLIFADPPYGKGLGARALLSLSQGGWMAPGAVVVLEESDRAEVTIPEGLRRIDERSYGDTKIMFLRTP